MKHRNKKKTAVAIVVVLAVVGASGGIFIRYQNTKDGEMKKETINVTETQAKTDTISNEIVGTGNRRSGIRKNPVRSYNFRGGGRKWGLRVKRRCIGICGHGFCFKCNRRGSK